MEFPFGRPRGFERQGLSNDIVTLIKQKILDGTLNPGDRIVESKLARELGISQTPVREAIRHLSGEGILTIVPNKGSLVKRLSMQDVFEIYSLRAILEGLAIKLATQLASAQDVADLERFFAAMKAKVDDDSVPSLLADSLQIHNTIIRLANHSRLTSAYSALSFQIARVNRILGQESTKAKEVQQHEELIVALKTGDPDFAEKTMRRHINRSYMEFITLTRTDHAGIWELEDLAGHAGIDHLQFV